MGTHLKVFIFLCLMVVGIIFLGTGCGGPDEEKEAAVSPHSALKTVKPDMRTGDTALETEKADLETSAPAVEPPPIATEIQAPETDLIDKGDRAGGAPPAEFTLVSALWETHTKSAPLFTHENHIKIHGIACNECHHVYEQGKNVWTEGMAVKKCEACHNDPTIKGEKKLPPEVQKKNLKLAFHGNCRVCHKKLKKENPESPAPVTCTQCHPKE